MLLPARKWDEKHNYKEDNRMSEKKPNILIVISDHLSPKMINNDYVNAPNINNLAESGISFSNAYCNYPLCVPSRSSFWTGRYPHEIGVEWNSGTLEIDQGITTLGEVFKKAGYQTEHIGKRHDAHALRDFNCRNSNKTRIVTPGEEAPWNDYYGTFMDRRTAELCAGFLKEEHEKPFLCVADFFNPHDVLPWMDDNIGPHDNLPLNKDLPSLPGNFEIEDFDNRADSIQRLCCRNRRLAQAAKWSRENYQHYLAAYCHYVEVVDRHIGMVIDALKSSPENDNTIIVLMADHGNGMCSHRLVSTHGNFYEEAAKVPMVFAGALPAGFAGGKRKQLVSLLDLFPTLCDFAGISAPDGLSGKSLAGICQNKDSGQIHEYLLTEWRQGSEFGPVAPGRMIRTNKFKYTRFLENDGEELYDIENDPGETKNLAENPEYLEVLKQHRTLLSEHVEKTSDHFYELKVDAKQPEHDPGYQNHVYNEKEFLTGKK